MGLRKINLILLVPFFHFCTKDKGVVDNGSRFPKDVAAILLTKCATSGCHNTKSKDAAAGISLSSWESLFLGSRNGAVVVPYRPDFSSLCFFTNSFPELGPSLKPQMPLNLEPLSREDYLKLKDWIRDGARDSNGEIAFAGNSSRSKLYVTNQLCDLVMVLDAASKLVMRCVDVGELTKTEFPVCVKVAPDNKSWYVSFLASTVLQKFDASNDSYIGSVDLGAGVWSTFELTSDSKYAFCVDNSSPGKIAYIDLVKMKVLQVYTHSGFIYPKSIVINNSAHKMYVGAENGNYISVVDFSQPDQPVIKQVVLDGSASVSNLSVNDPVTLCLDESAGLCFIGCRASKEIEIMDLAKDSVIGSVPINASPAFMNHDPGKNRLFVTCMDDSLSFSGNLGSVKVIDVISKQLLKTINSGYQPNGICINNSLGYAAVINSNISPQGPSPHHVSGCGGRNGNVTFIDLNTLELIPNLKYELAVYPYAIAIRK